MREGMKRIFARVVLVAFLSLSLSTCGGGGGGGGATGGGGDAGGGGGIPDYTMTVEPAGASGFQGSSVMVKASVARKAGFTGEVSVTIANPPTGVTAGTLTLPDNIVTGFLRIHLAPDIAAGGSLSLSVIGSNGSSTATVPLTVTVKPAEPSSQEKIAAALASGTIDYGTSLLYRAYAFHGDSRLPEPYRGSGSVKEDLSLRSEILAATAGLSPALQTALESFTVRPADPKSWYNQTSAQAPVASLFSRITQAFSGSLPSPAATASGWQWDSVRHPTLPIRVWAQVNDNATYSFASWDAIYYVLNMFDKIYVPMTVDMGTAPIRDDGEGGDDAIDVYIVDGLSSVYRHGDTYQETAGTGFATPDKPEVGKTSSGFILINRSNLNTSSFHIMLIHEFFHVLQFAHNQKALFRLMDVNILDKQIWETQWFVDASAEWASVHYDRTLEPWTGGRAAYEEVHRYFKERFQKSKESLNSYAMDYLHRYNAYIWAYFLEQETGGPGIIGAIWNRLESANSFEEADNAIDWLYPFKDNFRTFALRNLNDEFLPGDPLPYSKRYVKLDPNQFIDDKVEPPYDIRVLAGDVEQLYSETLEPLSAGYQGFKVSDPAVKQVVFDLSGLAATAGLDVDALIKTKDKGWETVRNLNGKDELKFCFDKPGEKLEDIRFILSNHQYKQGEKLLARFTARPRTTPCADNTWSGTFSSTYVFSTSGITRTEVWSGTVTLGHPVIDILGDITYSLDSASATVTWDEVGGLCNGHGEKTVIMGDTMFSGIPELIGSGFQDGPVFPPGSYATLFSDGSYSLKIEGITQVRVVYPCTGGALFAPYSSFLIGGTYDENSVATKIMLINNRMQDNVTSNSSVGPATYDITVTWDFGR